jgi:hypothetical protein
MKYTTKGKNRYVFLEYTKDFTVSLLITEGLSDSNIINKLHGFGVPDCNRNIDVPKHQWTEIEHYNIENANFTKELLNKNGRIIKKYSNKIIAVIDMSQLDKLFNSKENILSQRQERLEKYSGKDELSKLISFLEKGTEKIEEKEMKELDFLCGKIKEII